jgi:dolichol-phosphate mannosyltransferase
VTGVLVIVPTFNERDALPELAPRVLAHEGYRLLVVDDDSPDGTGRIADDLAREHPGRVDVLHRHGPRGLGRSYGDGIRRALDSDAAVIAQMDADLSHDPAYLPSLVAATADADLAIGSRYLNGVSVVNWPLRRLALSTAANHYVRLVTGMPIRDATSGFRCWRRSALERIPLDRLHAEGYAHTIEFAYAAYRFGCRITEVPIVFVERRVGRSKLDRRSFTEALWMPWWLRLRWITAR